MGLVDEKIHELAAEFRILSNPTHISKVTPEGLSRKTEILQDVRDTFTTSQQNHFMHMAGLTHP